MQAPNTFTCPTGSRLRRTPSTCRAVRSSPLPDKGVLGATENLAVAGAAPRLNSEFSGIIFTKPFKPTPRFCHHIVHRAANRRQTCEICRVVKVVRSQDVRGDQVVGEAGEGFPRGGLVHIGRDTTTRERIGVV